MRVQLVQQIRIPGTTRWESLFDDADGWTVTELDGRVRVAHSDVMGRAVAFDVVGVGYTIDPPQEVKRGSRR
jgi:hypothetical protein